MTDFVHSFFNMDGNLHGRFVQLDSSLSSILQRHRHRAPDQTDTRVEQLLAETLLLTVMLGNTLKFDGTFSLQTSSDGAVNLLVGDLTTEGALRGYARVAPEKLAATPDTAKPSLLLGDGHLAFSIRQAPQPGDDQQLAYQGVVILTSDGLLQAALTYFEQSVQLDTHLLIAIDQGGAKNGQWRGRGLLLQRLPDHGGHDENLLAINDNSNAMRAQDNWEFASACFATIKPDELLDYAGTPEAFLRRLFPLTSLEIAAAKVIRDQCRCSVSRVAGYLQALPSDELQDLFDEDGKLEVTCEFCSQGYPFTTQDFPPTTA
jgi:molecular chaperone Hsp33